MSAPGSPEALEIVRRLEAALLSLERDFAALDTEAAFPQRRQIDSRTSNAPPQGALAGTGALGPRAERSTPLTPDEHRRLTRHLEALLGEVRELADFLATGDSDPDPSDPR